MNLLNKEMLGIAFAIVVLYIIQQLLPKKVKKEGFYDANEAGIVSISVVLLILISIAIAYATYRTN